MLTGGIGVGAGAGEGESPHWMEDSTASAARHVRASRRHLAIGDIE